jgi:hypothetical protein
MPCVCCTVRGFVLAICRIGNSWGVFFLARACASDPHSIWVVRLQTLQWFVVAGRQRKTCRAGQWLKASMLTSTTAGVLQQTFLGRVVPVADRGGCHGHDSVTLRLPRAKHQHACTRAPGASRMTVDRKGHGEMRRTGAPRETPSCARLFLCSFPIFPHKPVVVAHTHACHGNSLEVDFEAFRVVTSQHASSAFAPASRTDHRKFCEHHESHTRYAMAGA